jgi:hypothetical protein
LPFAVKTGNKQETNENTERTQNKDLFPAHADGISENLAKPSISELVPRARGRNKRKPTKTSELPHLFHFQRHTPPSIAFLRTALFSLGGLLGWAREKGESARIGHPKKGRNLHTLHT